MFRPLRENGPAVLVPAAWFVVVATVLDIVSLRALFVAHAVMSVLLVAFAVTSWRDMADGVLRVWRLVLVAGTPVTFAGVAGFLTRGSIPSSALLALSLFGWMLLPAAGFLYTAQRVEAGSRVYEFGVVCCVAGAIVVGGGPSTTWTVVGLALVGIGQTAGILDATLRY